MLPSCAAWSEHVPKRLGEISADFEGRGRGTAPSAGDSADSFGEAGWSRSRFASLASMASSALACRRASAVSRARARRPSASSRSKRATSTANGRESSSSIISRRRTFADARGAAKRVTKSCSDCSAFNASASRIRASLMRFRHWMCASSTARRLLGFFFGFIRSAAFFFAMRLSRSWRLRGTRALRERPRVGGLVGGGVAAAAAGALGSPRAGRGGGVPRG